MDSTALPPPLCPPRRAGAARTPPARALRVRPNPACVSRPDAASSSSATAAAAKKPKRPDSSGDEEPSTKFCGGAADGKENEDAPAAAKIRILLRPCRRLDEAPRSPLSNVKRCYGGTADGHADAARTPAAKNMETLLGSEQAKRRASPTMASKNRRQAAGNGAASASPSSRSSDGGGMVRALLETARSASEAMRRRDMERLRAEARRELARVVKTVEFNDPFISPQDVLR